MDNMSDSYEERQCTAFRCMNYSWNLNLFSGPKAEIECWNCRNIFDKRLPFRNRPRVVCPYCNGVNIIPIVIG